MLPGRVQTIVAGASALIKRLCDELGLAEILDAAVRWDPKQCKLSPGTRIVALVVNALVHRRPLYHVAKFYAKQDVALLFGPEVRAEDFTDDALARALDDLAEADPKAIFSQVALRAVLREGMEVETLHADTTSRSVYGAYEGYPEDPLHITRGYSHQRRRDLKQIVFGVITNAEGFPVHAGVHDGNLADKTWNRQVLESFESVLAGRKPGEIIYIADSQLVTPENLELIAQKGVRFISRLPASFGLERELREQAWEAWQHGEGWIDVGTLAQRRNAEHYWVWETEARLYDHRYRFVVVRTSSPNRRQVQSLEREVKAEGERLAKATRELSRQRFACEPDAQAAWERFVREQAPVFHTLQATLQTETRTRRPVGRPRRDAPPPVAETSWRIQPEILPPSDAQLAEERDKRALFVLITNVPASRRSTVEVLREYKNQPSVERRFAFLQDPVIVDGIYLKRPDRAYALAFVFLLALLVAAYLERRIRHALPRTQEVLELGEGRKTSTPTIQTILDLLRSLQIVLIDTGRHVQRLLPDNTDPQIFNVLRLAGHSEAIYTQR